MFSRLCSGLLAVALMVTAAPAAHTQETLNFGIMSTEASQNLRHMWEPFPEDMSKATGMKVKAFFASDYAGIIEGMRFKKVDLSWIGNKGAIAMVERAVPGGTSVESAASHGLQTAGSDAWRYAGLA